MSEQKRNNKIIEENLITLLHEGKMDGEPPDEEAVKHLLPRYESRTQAVKDPIAEETKIVKQYIEETNKKYLDYVLEEE